MWRGDKDGSGFCKKSEAKKNSRFVPFITSISWKKLKAQTNGPALLSAPGTSRQALSSSAVFLPVQPAKHFGAPVQVSSRFHREQKVPSARRAPPRVPRLGCWPLSSSLSGGNRHKLCTVRTESGEGHVSTGSEGVCREQQDQK